MSTLIRFQKMHGLGNDFVVVDGINQNISLTAEQVRFLADRHLGIGFDQLLIVEPSDQKDIDFYYRIYNADGSQVGQCGNGARCLARFLHDRQLTQKNHLRITTSTTLLELDYQSAEKIRVLMGKPQTITPVLLDTYQAISLNLGNPHLVFCVPQVKNFPEINLLGSHYQNHPLFPEGVNVGFMQIIDHQHIYLRVYERGAGETLACGSGACAAAIAGIYQKLLISPVTVHLTHGNLFIEWDPLTNEVFLSGPTTNVFSGEILLS